MWRCFSGWHGLCERYGCGIEVHARCSWAGHWLWPRRYTILIVRYVLRFAVLHVNVTSYLPSFLSRVLRSESVANAL